MHETIQTLNIICFFSFDFWLIITKPFRKLTSQIQNHQKGQILANKFTEKLDNLETD